MAHQKITTGSVQAKKDCYSKLGEGLTAKTLEKTEVTRTRALYLISGEIPTFIDNCHAGPDPIFSFSTTVMPDVIRHPMVHPPSCRT
jgi:hypothetical protein